MTTRYLASAVLMELAACSKNMGLKASGEWSLRTANREADFLANGDTTRFDHTFPVALVGPPAGPGTWERGREDAQDSEGVRITTSAEPATKAEETRRETQSSGAAVTGRSFVAFILVPPVVIFIGKFFSVQSPLFVGLLALVFLISSCACFSSFVGDLSPSRFLVAFLPDCSIDFSMVHLYGCFPVVSLLAASLVFWELLVNFRGNAIQFSSISAHDGFGAPMDMELSDELVPRVSPFGLRHVHL